MTTSPESPESGIVRAVKAIVGIVMVAGAVYMIVQCVKILIG